MEVTKVFKRFIALQIDYLSEENEIKLADSCKKIFNRVGSLLISNPRPAEDETVDILIRIASVLILLLESSQFLPECFKEVINHGFECIFSTITPELLLYPELSTKFYEILRATSCRPAACLKLPPPTFATMIKHLLNSLKVANPGGVMKCLEGLKHLLEFLSLNSEHPGWKVQLQAFPTLLEEIQQNLLQLLASEETLPRSSFGFLSQCFYFLIVNAPTVYANCVTQLIRNTNEPQRTQLATYFTQLSSEIDTTKAKQYPSAQYLSAFEQKLQRFVCLYNSMLITK